MRTSSSALAPRYDSQSAEILDDPYPVYAQLRAAGSLCRSGPGQWAVTHYEDVARLLAEPTITSEIEADHRTFAVGSGSANSFYERIVLFRDMPAHQNLRRMLAPAVKSPSAVALTARLPAIVNLLLQPALDGTPFDAVEDLALPFALRVLCELIGFPSSDLQEIRSRARDLSKLFATRISETDRLLANHAVDWLRQYVGALLDDRGRMPRDDFLSYAARADHGLTFEEKIDNIAFLVFAGFETTANMMANGLAALLDNPAEFQRLRAQPDAVASAAEELLRYDPPIQGIARRARVPLEIAGRVIRPGRILVLLLGSANRDGLKFVNPDTLDIARKPNPHLSFGGGIHHCLGAPIARLEIRALLTGIREKALAIERSKPGVRRLNASLRCFQSLPAVIRPV